MITPSAMLIEMAQDMLKDMPAEKQESQLKEFRFALGSSTPDLEKGFLLGLQVARAWLATNPKAVQDGIQESF